MAMRQAAIFGAGIVLRLGREGDELETDCHRLYVTAELGMRLGGNQSNPEGVWVP
jgi:hypothetical protein